VGVRIGNGSVRVDVIDQGGGGVLGGRCRGWRARSPRPGVAGRMGT
jgi:hypothetical protein